MVSHRQTLKMSANDREYYFKNQFFSPAASCMSSFIKNCHCSLFLTEPLCKNLPIVLKFSLPAALQSIVLVNFPHQDLKINCLRLRRAAYNFFHLEQHIHTLLLGLLSKQYGQICSHVCNNTYCISRVLWKFCRQIWVGLAFPSWLKTQNSRPPPGHDHSELDHFSLGLPPQC